MAGLQSRNTNMMILIKNDVPDVIKINIPLLLRLMEYAEEAEDVDLHMIAENLASLSEKHKGGVLTMKHYWKIVP